MERSRGPTAGLTREDSFVKKKDSEADAGPVSSPTFEEALARLEGIIEELEHSEAPLERALALVQEGDELARLCEQQLREAEGKIVQLVERLGGVEFEPVETQEESQK